MVQYALASGFSPERVLLGLAGYGYDWPREGTARSLTHPQVMALFEEQRRLTPGLTLRWDGTAKSPYFHYGSGNQVWFENRESHGAKLQIAEPVRPGGRRPLAAGPGGPGQLDPAG